jgi:hypothetical protein
MKAKSILLRGLRVYWIFNLELRIDLSWLVFTQRYIYVPAESPAGDSASVKLKTYYLNSFT